MKPEIVAAVVVIGAALLTIVGLTTTGTHRRGHGIVLALVAGLFFPITWGVWYLRDEHPYRKANRV